MNITSNNTMIFAKEFDGKVHYRAGLSTKNVKGEYESAYIDVRMPKDTQLENKTKINITKGFLSFYKNKEGKDVFYLVIQEFKKLETQKEEPKEVYEIKTITAEQLDDPELPF